MSNHKQTDKTDSGRRKFLKTLGAAGGVAAVAAVSAEVVADADAEISEPEKGVDSKGYQETAHVREYYKSARI